LSESGSIADASTWANTPRVDVIDMVTGDTLSSAESTERLEMIGQAGVLISKR
jgi:hypothetical protein